MKKYLLPLLTLLVVLSSCQKEDDILTPVPQPPQTTTTNINGDTIINIDTTNNNGTGNVLQAFEDDYVVSIDNNNVTVVPPSAAFPGWGKNYNITKAEFSMISVDTSYSYTSTNFQSTWGNGYANFHKNGNNYGGGELMTTVHPRNGSTLPTHANSYLEKLMDMTITQYTYGAYSGILGLDIDYVTCNGTLVQWHVDMVVTEYSDGTLELSIDNTGYCTGGTGSNFGTGPWNSQLKITLVEQI
jgi:hypothetical protein